MNAQVPETPEVLAELQNAVLMAIGRNVFNFHRLEAILEKLVFALKTEFPPDLLRQFSSENTEQHIRKRRQAVEKMPLGRLVGEFLGAVGTDANTGRPVDTSNVSVTTSLHFDDAAFVDKLKSSLMIALQERNALIHTLLADLVYGSEDSCRQMIQVLEMQRQRLTELWPDLHGIWTNLQADRRDFYNYLQSTEFEDAFRRAKANLA